ncbi:MAG: hydrogenase maturation protease [Desulfatibacillaceae bacterium]|nr:hydrogenase maturation protease [Desulfatibacillaceae bacterium]
MKEPSRALLMGLGSPILSDDGVGIHIAEALNGRIEGLDTASSPFANLEILEKARGYSLLFVVDALLDAGGSIGELRVVSPWEAGRHTASSHGLDLISVMELGRSLLGEEMPQLARIYGVTAGCEIAFGKELTPALAGFFPGLVEAVGHDIRGFLAAADRKGR